MSDNPGQVEMQMDGGNLLVPVTVGDRAAIVALSPETVEAIRAADPATIPEVGTKQQWRFVIGGQPGPWQDAEVTVEERTVSALTPPERMQLRQRPRP